MKELNIKIFDKHHKQFLPHYMLESITVNKLYFWTMNKDYVIVLSTWLKDRNNKEIHTGDIVKYNFMHQEEISYVSYFKTWAYGISWCDEFLYYFIDKPTWLVDVEVIWNIYKDKDLLIKKD